MGLIRLAWWNVENLFDHKDASRHPDLARRLQNELKGWTVQVRDRKLDQLASVISSMFENQGPDFLGICEVENEEVVQLLVDRLTLPDRSYAVLTHDTEDLRGIEISFIYDKKILSCSNTGFHSIIKRSATRDIFWTTITHRITGTSFIVAGNHWPSRSGGQYETEPFRMLTAETVSYLLSHQHLTTGSQLPFPVLLMGDFNDEPFNRSIQEYLLAKRDPKQVVRAKNPLFWNCMWPLMSTVPSGTFYYGSEWNMLDQCMVTKEFLKKDSPLTLHPEGVTIYRTKAMQKRNGTPRRFGRPAQKISYDRNGYSDHFPIVLQLEFTK
ncbi:MAG: endonuclease/exonuclease/phosphatase family protein [bacterium]